MHLAIRRIMTGTFMWELLVIIPATPRLRYGRMEFSRVFESRESDNQNFGPGQLQIGGKGNENSASEVAEILIYSGELNTLQLATLEGYLAHKWSLQEDILPDDHPYAQLDPFGIQLAQANSRSEGGDPAEVIIFWGDERIETKSTATSPDDNSSWDYKIVLSQSADIGTLDKLFLKTLRRTHCITSVLMLKILPEKLGPTKYKPLKQ